MAEPHKDLLEAAVREAGALALDWFGRAPKVWDKSPGHPVTEADMAVDALLRERLMAVPGIGWLSEESLDDPARLSCREVWIVDPIDGTRAFIKRRPEFTIAAALVRDGAPVLAAIFNPATDEFFAASKGNGATLNGVAMKPSAVTNLHGARMLGAKSLYTHPKWPEAWPPVITEQRNSIAYRACLVASGQFDGAVSLTGKSDWDLAAADLITHEAGGVFCRHDGAAFRYNEPAARHASIIVCAPGLAGEILRRTRAVGFPV